MRKRVPVPSALILTTLLSFGACGGSDVDESPTPAGATQTPTVTVDPTPTPTPSTTDTPDPGTPTPDTSTPTPDTSTPTPDTSTPTPDTPTPDSTTPTPDSATPTPDASTPTPDTSTPTPSTPTPNGSDADGDGYNTDVDCNDADASIYPGAVEVCDGVDTDCDGTVDTTDLIAFLGTGETAWVDYTSTLTSGSSSVPTVEDGALVVCPGTYDFRTNIAGTVSMTGYGDKDTIILSNTQTMIAVPSDAIFSAANLTFEPTSIAVRGTNAEGITLDDVTVRGSSSGYGVEAVGKGALTITDSLFSNNSYSVKVAGNSDTNQIQASISSTTFEDCGTFCFVAAPYTDTFLGGCAFRRGAGAIDLYANAPLALEEAIVEDFGAFNGTGYAAVNIRENGGPAYIEDGAFRNNIGETGNYTVINGYYPKDLTIVDTRFEDNRSPDGSGFYTRAINVYRGGPTLSLDDVDFRRNGNQGTNPAFHSVLYIDDNPGELTAVLNDITMTDNLGTALFYGGNGTASLSNSNFEGNINAGDGGALSLSSNMTIVNTNFINNSGANGGAIRTYSFTGPLPISGGRFEGNTASGKGGAIYSEKQSPVIENAEFINNSAGTEGGAIYTTLGSLALTGCTFTGNSATNIGGAIRLPSPAQGSATDCTFESNTATHAGAVSWFGPFSSVNSSWGTGGNDNSPEDLHQLLAEPSGTVHNFGDNETFTCYAGNCE